MEHAPAPLLAAIAQWSPAAQQTAWACRSLFLQTAQDNDTGPIAESLKWGQPAWRPSRPRMGSTLRMFWVPATPDILSLYVDCKTDLASRMGDLYPDLALNDGRRQLGISLNEPLPEQALSHLAQMTFTYHRAKRVGAVG